MINIISKSLTSKTVSGPQKVAENLIKGLDRIGYPYVVNQKLDACKRLWIHDDFDALVSSMNLGPETKIIAGPNIFILPRSVPDAIDFSKIIYLHPSPWAVDFWHYLGFNKGTLESWPVGIDMDVHAPTNQEKDTVLVYFKERLPEELEKVESILKGENIKYEVVLYGKYIHDEYVEKLSRTKYIVWVGRQESQGLALEESLAMNIPILVWDVKSFGHWNTSAKIMESFTKNENSYSKATSAFYFDERCGLITKDGNLLPDYITTMENTWYKFNPRQYILENLTLEKQARDFVNLYNKYYNLSFEEGLKETQIKMGLWKNALWYNVFITRIKDFLKTLKKHL